MPTTATPSPQLDLFVHDTPTYRTALTRYDVLRPILQGPHTLTQQSQATGIPYHQLWRDLQRFQRAGLAGLLDRRTLPHARGKVPIAARVPPYVLLQIVRLALAQPSPSR